MSKHQLMLVIHGEPKALIELQREILAQSDYMAEIEVPLELKKLEIKPLD